MSGELTKRERTGYAYASVFILGCVFGAAAYGLFGAGIWQVSVSSGNQFSIGGAWRIHTPTGFLEFCSPSQQGITCRSAPAPEKK